MEIVLARPSNTKSCPSLCILYMVIRKVVKDMGEQFTRFILYCYCFSSSTVGGGGGTSGKVLTFLIN